MYMYDGLYSKKRDTEGVNEWIIYLSAKATAQVKNNSGNPRLKSYLYLNDKKNQGNRFSRRQMYESLSRNLRTLIMTIPDSLIPLFFFICSLFFFFFWFMVSQFKPCCSPTHVQT